MKAPGAGAGAAQTPGPSGSRRARRVRRSRLYPGATPRPALAGKRRSQRSARPPRCPPRHPACAGPRGRAVQREPLAARLVSRQVRRSSFTEALGSGRPAEAVGVYGGPLLDGFHVDDGPESNAGWTESAPDWRASIGEALKQLATAAEGAGVWDEAARWWARAVEHDPPNSHLVLQHVRVLAAMGDGANAIQVLEAHARRLREEFRASSPTARSSPRSSKSAGGSCRAAGSRPAPHAPRH